MAVKPVTLAVLGGGVVILWSGIKGTSPLTVFKDLLKGKNPSGEAATDAITTDAFTSTYGYGGSPSGGGGTNTPTNGTAAANQALAKLLAAPYTWSTGSNWTSLVNLWNRESSWNNRAQNPSSGAYGIPQALPYTKMPKSAWPASGGGSSNSGAQISWGLSYIKQTYGSPNGAWQHEQENGWY